MIGIFTKHVGVLSKIRFLKFSVPSFKSQLLFKKLTLNEYSTGFCLLNEAVTALETMSNVPSKIKQIVKNRLQLDSDAVRENIIYLLVYRQ